MSLAFIGGSSFFSQSRSEAPSEDVDVDAHWLVLAFHSPSKPPSNFCPSVLASDWLSTSSLIIVTQIIRVGTNKDAKSLFQQPFSWVRGLEAIEVNTVRQINPIQPGFDTHQLMNLNPRLTCSRLASFLILLAVSLICFKSSSDSTISLPSFWFSQIGNFPPAFCSLKSAFAPGGLPSLS